MQNKVHVPKVQQHISYDNMPCRQSGQKSMTEEAECAYNFLSAYSKLYSSVFGFFMNNSLFFQLLSLSLCKPALILSLETTYKQSFTNIINILSFCISYFFISQTTNEHFIYKLHGIGLYFSEFEQSNPVVYSRMF